MWGMRGACMASGVCVPCNRNVARSVVEDMTQTRRQISAVSTSVVRGPRTGRRFMRRNRGFAKDTKWIRRAERGHDFRVLTAVMSSPFGFPRQPCAEYSWPRSSHLGVLFRVYTSGELGVPL